MKAMVLASGGLDSTTALALAVDKHGKDNVIALTISYGQKHDKEIQSAIKVAEYYGVEHLFLDLTKIFQYSDCSLLKHSDEAIPEKSYAEQSRLALDNLKEIYQLLKSYRVADYVTFDLGVIRNFSYYTGLVFEVYTPGLGFPVCGGGRYDNMLEDFGCNRPATGFALGIERVLLAMERQKLEMPHQQKDVYLAYAEGKSDEAVSRALALRDIGRTVDLANGAMTQEQANEYKELRGYDKLIYVE